MASVVSLLRDTRLFVSTRPPEYMEESSPLDTFRINVLSDISFSQETNTQEVTLNESGGTSARGKKVFNVSLAPIDFSFSTYFRPYKHVQATGLASGNTVNAEVACAEEILLRSALNAVPASTIGTYGIFDDYVVKETLKQSGGSSTITFTTTPTNLAVGDYLLQLGESSGAFSNRTRMAIVTEWLGSNTAAIDGSFQNGANDVLVIDPDSSVIRNEDFVKFTSIRSDVSELQELYFYIVTSNTVFVIKKAQINAFEIPLSIDGISQYKFSGNGLVLAIEPDSTALFTYLNVDIQGDPYAGVRWTGCPVHDAGGATPFLVGKKSLVTVKDLSATAPWNSGNEATFSFTGGTVNYNNNLTALTPEELATVNKPIGIYTGTREVDGNIDLYLRVGGTDDVASLADYIMSSRSPVNTFLVSFYIGGTSGTYVKVDFNKCNIDVPNFDSGQDIISTQLRFRARGTDIAVPDDIAITYYMDINAPLSEFKVIAGEGTSNTQPTFTQPIYYDFNASDAIHLNFMDEGKSLDPRFTYTRASGKTRINKYGYIEQIGDNAIPFNYDPETLQPLGLQVEETRTNGWRNDCPSATQGTTASVDPSDPYYVVAPDGGNPIKYVPNSGTRTFPAFGSLTLDKVDANTGLGAVTTVSITGYFKDYGSPSYIPNMTIAFHNSGADIDYLIYKFNPKTGAVLNKTIGTTWTEIVPFTITQTRLGMYKVSGVYKATQDATSRNMISFAVQCGNENGVTNTYVANGTSGFMFKCLQLEKGDFPTSYIHTTNAAATRASERGEVIPANIGTMLNELDWSVGAVYRMPNSYQFTGHVSVVSLRYNTVDYRVNHRISNSGQVTTFYKNNGTGDKNLTSTNTVAPGSRNASSFNAKVGDTVNLALNGVVEDSDSPCPNVYSAGVFNRIDVGCHYQFNEPFNGFIEHVVVHPSSLGDSVLKRLSNGAYYV
jgi:hypothetical protein